jgi:hypothetical protein
MRCSALPAARCVCRKVRLWLSWVRPFGAGGAGAMAGGCKRFPFVPLCRRVADVDILSPLPAPHAFSEGESPLANQTAANQNPFKTNCNFPVTACVVLVFRKAHRESIGPTSSRAVRVRLRRTNPRYRSIKSVSHAAYGRVHLHSVGSSGGSVEEPRRPLSAIPQVSRQSVDCR